MNIVDILVTIIVVTILVTIVLAVVTYIAYKLRLARRPISNGDVGESRYFDVHQPPAGREEEGVSAKPAAARDPERREAAGRAAAPPRPAGSADAPRGQPVGAEMNPAGRTS